MGLGILQSQALIIPRPLEFGRISAKNQKTPYLTMLLNSGLSHLPSGLQGFRASGLQGFRALAPFMLTVYWPITIEISQATDDFER
jgi:hypothetical protein